MAESRLTVRTLALAMVALGLACVHAARGDGRGNIATFSGRSGSASGRVATFTSAGSRGTSGSVVTVRGDSAPASKRSTGQNAGDRTALVARRNAAAAGVTVPGGAVAGRPGRSGKPSALALSARAVPQIEVRKVAVMSDGSQVVEPRRVAMVSPERDSALDTELKKLSAPPRNAFSLPGAGSSTLATGRAASR